MIAVTQQENVTVLALAQGKANTMDIELCRALTAQFGKLKTAKNTQAVVMTGQANIFSAGVNLLRIRDGGAAYTRKFLVALNKMFETIYFFPKPVVSAVNGHAIAGGCVLACCADFRVMARASGRIGVTELLVGLPFPTLAFEIMRASAPAKYFPELIYTGATFAPENALERGLIDEISEPVALMPRALEAASTLAALSPQAFAMTKQHMRLPASERLKKDGRKIDAAVSKAWTAPAANKTISNYVARTLKK